MSRLDKLKQLGKKPSGASAHSGSLVPVSTDPGRDQEPQAGGELTRYRTGSGLQRLPVTAMTEMVDVAALRERHGRTASATAQTEAAFRHYAEVAATPSQVKVAILMDATGSMQELINDTRTALVDIVRRAQEQAKGKLQLQLFVFRQYGDPEVMACSDPSDEVAYLTGWLGRVRAEGGDGLSAIEVPLQQIWDRGDFVAVILAGDVRSHTADEVRRKAPGAKTVREIATALGNQQKPVYTFVVPMPGDDRYTQDTIEDFRMIAELSKGQSAILDGSTAVRDMAVAVILKHISGTQAVQNYLRQCGGAMSQHSLQFVKCLALEHKPS